MIWLDRRTFLKVSASAVGELLLTLYTGACRNDEKGTPFSPNAFVKIDPNGRVTITIPRPEMGQGVRTSLAMLIADGLDCDWKDVRIEQADLNQKRYGPQYVGGSGSVQNSYEPLRQAGAVAREMLLRAAANQWQIGAELCESEQGSVIHSQDQRRLSYGSLIGAAAKLPVPKTVPTTKSFRYVGHRQNGVDIKEIATGRIRFGIDTRVPSMLFASVEHCPAVSGRMKSFDDREAKKIKGVHAVIYVDANALPDLGENSPAMPCGVAVIADSTWTAMKAREALKIEWDFGNAVAAGTDQMRDEAMKRAQFPKWNYRNDGDSDKALKQAPKVIEAVYEVPLVAHATMEPMNCTADIRANRAEIWAPTQNPGAALDVVKKMTGLKEEAITIHPTRMGGGFGRRFYNDYVAEAVYISKAIGRPVQTLWTRQDDMRHGFFRPAGYHVLRGGLDSSGNPVVWTQHLINASRGHYLKWKPEPGQQELKPEEIGPEDFPAHFIPNIKLEYTPLDSPIPRGQWRAVEDSSNVFVIQSFLAELAEAAGMNEYDFLHRLIAKDQDVPYYGSTYQTSRLRKVLETAAHFGDWGKPLPNGWGRGIAAAYANHSYTAQVAEVEVSVDHHLRVHRIVAAIDCGRVINPSGVEAQVQGAILFSLSATLMQEITVKNGHVMQTNFHEFPVIRMNQTPRIDVHMIPSEGKPKGVGEAAVGQTPVAITNAIFHATGKRIRRLPLINEGFQI